MKKIEIDKNILIQSIKDNKPKNQLAKELGIDVGVITARCKEYGIEYKVCSWKKGKTFPTNIYPYVNKEWLQTNWLNTDKSLHTLSLEHNIPQSLLESRASLYKLKKTFKYRYNVSKLTDTTDYHLYYLAGLLATDGWMDKQHDQVNIGLTGDDEKELLTEINNYYENTKPVKTYDNLHYLSFYGRGVKKIFIEYFNIPNNKESNKTFEVGVPEKFYNEDCVKAYVRGCLDGDGCIGLGAKSFTICNGSVDFIQGMKNIFNSYVGISCNVYYQKGTSLPGTFYPCIEIQGTNCKKLLDWIYSLQDCFYLRRKYLRYCGVSDIV